MAAGTSEGTERIPLRARVEASDGRAGRLASVVVDPTARRVTHLVVREEHRPHTERLVPMDLVAEIRRDRIVLSCSRAELGHLEEAEQTRFVDVDEGLGNLDESWVDPTTAVAWPYRHPHKTVALTEPRLPKGEVGFGRGAPVRTEDGHAGVVEGFVVDPEDGAITHLVVGEHHFLRHHDLCVPVGMVSDWDGSEVRVSATHEDLERLPPMGVASVSETLSARPPGRR